MNTLMVRVNDKSTINKCRTEGRVEGDTNMDPRNGDATCMVVPVRHYACCTKQPTQLVERQCGVQRTTRNGEALFGYWWRSLSGSESRFFMWIHVDLSGLE